MNNIKKASENCQERLQRMSVPTNEFAKSMKPPLIKLYNILQIKTVQIN